MTPQAALGRLVGGDSLAEDEMAALMTALLDGQMTPAQIGAIAVALRMKGESEAELAGAARAMRAHMTRVEGAPAGAVDTCGTGGDGAATLNVSTAAGLVVAAAGVPVAKHGNRAASGSVGGADVLEGLGVRLVLDPAAASACLREVGFVFLFAPAFHPALRHAAAPRRELGVRTFFNLIGPLANPAGVGRQVIGVAERRWVLPLAHVLQRLGAERAWVVHGAVGLDELALSGESLVADVTPGAVDTRTVRAADAGVPSAPLAALRVTSVADAVARVRAVLAGEHGPARDVVCLNAAAALVVGGAARDLRDGAGQAARAIDGGAATALLERLVAFTQARGSGA
ncbi:MAG TPA: anthranilate phosphoribosyltransferase [Candidatus Eisenbacteria bacterium]|nr:anthranilate phosphoribosyltransferase [Candidatus Eisenbacteria bacterium]